MQKLEILAPGGDLLAAKAAILAGADAVYLGLPKFNARMRAANISLQQLKQLAELAGDYNTRLYLTLNTLLSEPELSECLSLAADALNAGVDALIVQDYGLLYLLQQLLPGARLHGSTQLTTHSCSQVVFLRQFGLRQINLARELSAAELTPLVTAAHTAGMLAEVFVHGAYCIAFSGQCYLSCFLSGLSGNRGTCVQPCRRTYRVNGFAEPKPLLNLKDNNALPLAEPLTACGVDSLKIEGRRKHAMYTYAIVRTWRQWLSGHGVPDRGKDLGIATGPGLVFNRDFHAGYLAGRIEPAMFTPVTIDQSLRVIGQVISYTADTGELRINGESMTAGTEANIFTADNSYIASLSVEAILPGKGRYRVRLQHQLKGRILAGQLLCGFPADREQPVLEAAAAALERPRQPLEISLAGSPGEPLTACFTTGATSVTIRSTLLLQPARQNGLTAQSAAATFGRLGGTPFHLTKIDCSALNGQLFLPLSEQNALRRRAMAVLLPGPKQYSLPDTWPALPAGRPQVTSRLVVLLDCDADAAFFLDQGCRVFRQTAEPAAFPGDGTLPWLPSIIPDNDLPAYQQLLADLKPASVVCNHSGLGLAAAEQGVSWIAGPLLNLANSYALQAMQLYGRASGGFLSPELGAEQLAAIHAPPDFQLYLQVFGPVCLLKTRQCLLRQSRPCRKAQVEADCLYNCEGACSIEDNQGQRLRVVKQRWQYTSLYNEPRLCLPAAVKRFRGSVAGFLLDMRNPGLPPLSAEVQQQTWELFSQVLTGGNLPTGQQLSRLLPGGYTSGRYHSQLA